MNFYGGVWENLIINIRKWKNEPTSIYITYLPNRLKQAKSFLLLTTCYDANTLTGLRGATVRIKNRNSEELLTNNLIKVNGKHVLVCNCEGTMNIDDSKLAKASGSNEMLNIAYSLCQEQIKMFEKAIQCLLIKKL